MKKIILFFFAFSLVFSSLNTQTSLEFDGVDDYAQISTSGDSAFHFLNDFTIEAWIKMDTLGFWPTIASNSSPAYNGFWFGVNVSGYGGLQVFDGNWYNVSGTTNVIDSSWHHLAGIYRNDSLFILVDGTLEGSAPASFAVYDNTPLTIGNDAFNDILTGRIEDLRFWNIAKPYSDIIQYKDSCLTGQESNLVAFYQFEEGTGNTFADLTGNNHYGSLINMDTSAAWTSGLNCTYSTISIKEVITLDEISIFPNPSQGIVNIDLSDLVEASIHIFNSNGKLIYKIENISKKTYQLEFNETPAIYFVVIRSNNQQQHFKLIKI